MWVSKAKQKKEKKRGGQSRELSLFHFFKPSPGEAAGPLCKRLRLGASVLLKKKSNVWETFRTSAGAEPSERSGFSHVTLPQSGSGGLSHRSTVSL